MTSSSAVIQQAVLTSATDRRRRIVLTSFIASLVFLLMAIVLAIGVGPFAISADKIFEILIRALESDPVTGREALVFWNLRLPRVMLGGLVGAALAVSGALMQGLFRNPLADPGLVGVSSGSALAAAIVIVMGDSLLGAANVSFALLPAAAFLGGLATTTLLYVIATREGRTSVSTMLLAGIAIGALAGAALGFLSFVSDDRQLRDLTFWSLGSLGGATWTKVSIVAAIVIPLLLLAPFLARALNALLMGESEAYYLGFPVQRVKIACIILVAGSVGASVAAAGVIGFVGIVVPHVIRLLLGPDHKIVLPLSATLGGVLLVSADAFARIVIAPAELPIGIVTASLGAPFFLWLLLRRGRSIF